MAHSHAAVGLAASKRRSLQPNYDLTQVSDMLSVCGTCCYMATSMLFALCSQVSQAPAPVCVACCILLQPRRKVCIAMDDSVSSQHALEWLESTLLRNGDEVHIVVVALPVPYPVSAGSCHVLSHNSAGMLAQHCFACSPCLQAVDAYADDLAWTGFFQQVACLPGA